MAVDISPLASKSQEFTGSLIVQTANRRDGCHLKRPSRPLSVPLLILVSGNCFHQRHHLALHGLILDLAIGPQ